MTDMLPVLLRGIGLGGSLIIAIGAQNAHVLRHGLKRSYVFWVAGICTACDWTLILLGGIGFGAIINAFPLLTTVAAWGGAIFLFVYGILSFRSAIRPKAMNLQNSEAPVQSLRSVILLTLAVSLLNPHVYLDTVVLVGGIAAQYELPNRLYFVIGAGLASTLWFFGLGYGAKYLAPVFQRPIAWRILDTLIGVVMWAIAASLIAGELA